MNLCKNKIFGIKVESVINYLEYKDSKKFYERLRENYEVNIERKINPGTKTDKKSRIFFIFGLF